MGVRLIEHPQGTVAGTGKVGGSLDDVSQYARQVNVRLNEKHGFDERLEAHGIIDATKRHELRG